MRFCVVLGCLHQQNVAYIWPYFEGYNIFANIRIRIHNFYDFQRNKHMRIILSRKNCKWIKVFVQCCLMAAVQLFIYVCTKHSLNLDDDPMLIYIIFSFDTLNVVQLFTDLVNRLRLVIINFDQLHFHLL